MFKIIIVVFLIIAFVPAVRRFLFWLIVGKQMVNEQKRQNKSQTPPKTKGDGVHVDYVPKDTKGSNFQGGQYVDYEEVD